MYHVTTLEEESDKIKLLGPARVLQLKRAIWERR